MTPFSILTAGRILFGRGEAAKAAGLIAGFGASVLLVHGARPGRAAWLVSALTDLGCRVTTLPCAGEPTLDGLQSALADLRAAPPDVVAAIGGGSVIDMAKALAALIPSRGPVPDYLEVVGKGLPLDHAPLPFVALPTTAGTGAEVTKNAVIGVPEHQRKVSLRDDRMLPDIALVDPALTDGAPRAVTLATGLDAVTQVIEPYVSCKATPFTDALCRPAIPLGLAALKTLMAGEDATARDHMAWVSLCGGMALANAGLGAVHGLAGVIGGVAPAPHGAVCGVLLPHVLATNTAQASGPYAARLAEVAGWINAVFPGDDPFQALAGWARQNGLPALTEMGLPPEAHPQVAEAAGLSSSMKGNPVALPVSALIAILQRAG